MLLKVRGKQMNLQKPRFSEHQWYDSIRTMSEVGDLDEYGRFCIEGRDVTKLGPQNVVDLNEVIRDAIVRGGGDTWSVPDFTGKLL